jgi:glycosyltransferase involved in cell wall biosynthesis
VPEIIDPMRIAQVAPLAEAVPPKLYGGTERIVSYLTEELTALGHEVTLFASGDSVTSAELQPILPQAIRLDPSIRDPAAPHVLMVQKVLDQAARFDIVHFHIDHLQLPAMRGRGLPFVSTFHGRLDLPELQPLLAAFPEAPFISISESQRRPLQHIDVNWAGTILHGLPENLLPFSPRQQGYIAFLGRISPEKGPDTAIRIARAAGIPIRIAAKVDRADQAYFDEVVAPLLELDGVEFIGEINEAQKAEFLGNALCLLTPIAWPEPFGLVMIEAMACGTPVIAFNRGSVPEVVEDGVSGFIVEDELGALAALKQVLALDRARVRAAFEARFTARRMAEDHLALYRRLLGRERATMLRAV